MSIIWQAAPTPFLDPTGTPYAGARAFFFDANTTTPRVVYRDSGMNIAHDHPVVANSGGMFPAIFLPLGDYRVRIETAAGVVLWDTDGITAPGTGSGGGGGGTPGESFMEAGDFIASHRSGVRNGWVRANGRSIGNATSGATERANADCEALFLHLWGQDTTLSVSGGRGVSADGDWSAGKRIDLPDLRGRVLAGLTAMGATDAGNIAANMIDNSETSNTLGATAGVGSVTLTVGQMPYHNHGGWTLGAGSHAHQYTDTITARNGNNNSGTGGAGTDYGVTGTTSTAGDHGHGIPPEGGGGAHPNVQPTAFATVYIKL